MQAIQFIVSGKVQKVYFRKYSAEKANELGLFGWVKNESNGTVIGHAQGTEDGIEVYKLWLSNVGSPKSRIDKMEFVHVELKEYSNFIIDRGH